jgi:hypothetical protein
LLARRGDVLEYIVLLILLDLMYRLADAFEKLRERKPMRAGLEGRRWLRILLKEGSV